MVMAYAIIVAGGQGKRMGSSEPKQYLKLGEVPILVHTLRVFQAAGVFKKILLVLPDLDFKKRIGEIEAYTGVSPLIFVKGGDTRQDSVYNALNQLKVLAQNNDIVCVHDAVRPLIDIVQIINCIKVAQEYGAAVLGVPVHETVKRCDDKGCVVETVPRENLWLAKTPQAVRFSFLWQSYVAAIRDGIVATDDASLLERLQIPVHMVLGSRTNIKITEPEDLIIISKLLSIS